MNTTELETVFIQQFFCLHGLPDKIVSDQGPPFVLALRLAVQHSLHIRLALSMAYHQGTYCQTERTNPTMETYLCHFIVHRQHDWADWIPIAEVSFNKDTAKIQPLYPCACQVLD